MGGGWICPMVGFGINVESSGSTTREWVSLLNPWFCSQTGETVPLNN